MPDEQGNTKSDQEDLPDSPLHAYKEGREEDIEKDDDQKGQPPEQKSEDAPDMGEPNPEGGQTQEGGHEHNE